MNSGFSSDNQRESCFYPSTFVCGHFSQKIQFLNCLHSSVALWVGIMVNTEGKWFEFQVCRSLENIFFMEFSWNLIVSLGVLKKIWLERYIFVFVSKPKNKKNKWIEWKIFQGCFKNKKEKNHEEIEFHNSIQERVFTTFNGCSCRKVLERMPKNRNIWYLFDRSKSFF